MIYDKQDYHKTPEPFFLVEEVCSREQMENHDAHCDIQHSVKEYLKVHNNCKFPAVAQRESVLVSILHQADEDQLKKLVRKQDKEAQSIRGK